MKLLVFEYITGGGFSGHAFPEALLAEGRQMLQALLADLTKMTEIEVRVMLDERCRTLADAYDFNAWIVDEDRFEQQFRGLLIWADAVWLIAPEFEGILEKYCAWVEEAGKRLLNSSAAAVALTADKWRTFETLQAAGIPTVVTDRLSNVSGLGDGAWVIKPVDGAGCRNTWLVSNAQEFAETLALIDNPQNYLIQPFLEGDNQSLSGLFYQGQSELLCINRQILSCKNRCFKLLACDVNAVPSAAVYQQLLANIASAVPGLFGYVGIDVIVREGHILVVDINPRFTSSYAGINTALGLNCAELILKLPQHPVIASQKGRSRVAIQHIP